MLSHCWIVLTKTLLCMAAKTISQNNHSNFFLSSLLVNSLNGSEEKMSKNGHKLYHINRFSVYFPMPQNMMENEVETARKENEIALQIISYAKMENFQYEIHLDKSHWKKHWFLFLYILCLNEAELLFCACYFTAKSHMIFHIVCVWRWAKISHSFNYIVRWMYSIQKCLPHRRLISDSSD